MEVLEPGSVFSVCVSICLPRNDLLEFLFVCRDSCFPLHVVCETSFQGETQHDCFVDGVANTVRTYRSCIFFEVCAYACDSLEYLKNTTSLTSYLMSR